MVVLLKSHPLSIAELDQGELDQGGHRVLDQVPSPPIAQFGQAASFRKSLGGSKLLPFKNDGGHCVLGDFQCCRICWGTMTCTVNCGTLYRQVCAFPDHVQSTEFTTGRLQSSFRNISRMINGNRMHLSSISSLIAKDLNTYVNKVSVYYF